MQNTSTELISVHFRTPDLILKQYLHIRKHIGDIPIRIIDGSQHKYRVLDTIEEVDDNFSIDYFNYNIHHGPGMDYGIKSSKYKYVFILDSDNWPNKDGLLDGMMELMDEKTYGVGSIINGCLMPMTMLIQKSRYGDFHKFIKHGSPMHHTWMDIIYEDYDMTKRAAGEVCATIKRDEGDIIKHFPCGKYSPWPAQKNVTRRRFGIHLNDSVGTPIPINKKKMSWGDDIIINKPSINIGKRRRRRRLPGERRRIN